MKKFMIMTMIQKNGKCVKVVGNRIFSCPVNREDKDAVSNRKQDGCRFGVAGR